MYVCVVLLTDCTFRPVLATKKAAKYEGDADSVMSEFVDTEELTNRLFNAHTHKQKKNKGIELAMKEKQVFYFSRIEF